MSVNKRLTDLERETNTGRKQVRIVFWFEGEDPPPDTGMIVYVKGKSHDDKQAVR